MKSKSGKAEGPSNFPIELVKCILLEIIVELFNKVMLEGVPVPRLESRLHILPQSIKRGRRKYVELQANKYYKFSEKVVRQNIETKNRE